MIWNVKGRDLAITVGRFSTNPEKHVFSKVAGEVDFCIDVRSQSRETLDEVREEIDARPQSASRLSTA